MRPYVIWTIDYSHATGGIKVLHRFCHELNLVGQKAYVASQFLNSKLADLDWVGPHGVPLKLGRLVTNPEWNTPVWKGPITKDAIAVYPEIVFDNPYLATRVVRWVLFFPGKNGGALTYDESEIVFSWDKEYLDAPILNLPAIETEFYMDRKLPRRGSLYFVGKGRLGETNGSAEVTQSLRRDREALASALNRAELLITFDDYTALEQIAWLCGCPVYHPSTGETTLPSGFREYYLSLYPEFQRQLAKFIELTQW